VTTECRGNRLTERIQRMQGLRRSGCTCALAVDTELDDSANSFEVETNFFHSCWPADREEAELFLEGLVEVGQNPPVRGWSCLVVAGPHRTWLAETLQDRVEPMGFGKVVLQPGTAP